jgi:hypothetical protein
MYKTNPFIICAKLRLIIQQHKALLFNRVISTIDVLNLKCNMMYTIPNFLAINLAIGTIGVCGA